MQINIRLLSINKMKNNLTKQLILPSPVSSKNKIKRELQLFKIKKIIERCVVGVLSIRNN